MKRDAMGNRHTGSGDGIKRAVGILCCLGLLCLEGIPLRPMAREADSADGLHRVSGADTRGLITLNLYNYGSGSTGKDINEQYRENPKLPGFQSNGGTSDIPSLKAFRSTEYFNFGDIVTCDRMDGEKVTPLALSPQGINRLRDMGNSPISRYSQVMADTLRDGYPALVDGTSLSYLFDGGEYAKKVNCESITGLFQYDGATQSYSFDSRRNFAAFDASADCFTLYRETLTPNFIMYPFGNFLPFQDIEQDACQVSQMDEAYFQDQAAQAGESYRQTGQEPYAQLARVLTQFLDYARQDGWGEDWTARQALERYFHWGGDLPELQNEEEQLDLDQLYGLDYTAAADFFFGMEMKLCFQQPKDGLGGEEGSDPVTFFFAGDDDVWIYVDGVLFLDLSGIHRHVGGKIDFSNGTVSYYSLDTKTGELWDVPYKTVKFSQLVDSGELDSSGTFTDYSSHTLALYYLERGSGSSVCQMRFNLPLLREDAVSITNTLSGTEEGQLGNPNAYFQVLGEDGTVRFQNAVYEIYDGENHRLGEGLTDENGIFALKSGQTAVFPESAGDCRVQELLRAETLAQYKSVTVNGCRVTSEEANSGGILSPVVSSEAGALFAFDHRILDSALGSLEISNRVEAYHPLERQDTLFGIYLLLDGQPVPKGTRYFLDGEPKTVAQEGWVFLGADQTAAIGSILPGTEATVQALPPAGEKGYGTYYEGTESSWNAEDECASGIVGEFSAVTVVNVEYGAAVVLSGTQTVENSDGGTYESLIRLEQVTDRYASDVVPGGKLLETMAVFSGKQGQEDAGFRFTLSYAGKKLTELPAVFYYRVTEVGDSAGKLRVDSRAYVAEITVAKAETGLMAALTGLYCAGQAAERIHFSDTLTGSLTVINTVQGTLRQKKGIAFAVSLATEEMGSYPFRVGDSAGVLDLTDGKATVVLKPGEQLTISGLAVGTAWTVTEEATGWQISSVIGDQKTDGPEAKGTVTSGGAEVTFVNIPGQAKSAGPVFGLLSAAVLAGCLPLWLRKRRRIKQI